MESPKTDRSVLQIWEVLKVMFPGSLPHWAEWTVIFTEFSLLLLLTKKKSQAAAPALKDPPVHPTSFMLVSWTTGEMLWVYLEDWKWMKPKIPLTAQEVRCWTGLDAFRPSHPTANLCQAPTFSFRDEIGSLTHEHAHCAYVPLLKAFEILSLDLIRQQFTADLWHIPVLLTVILKVQLQYAWWWFITPLSTALSPQSIWCCYYGYVKHTWQETLSDLGRPDP